MARGRAFGRFRTAGLLVVALLLGAAVVLLGRGSEGAISTPGQTRPIGLFTSLPLLWRETAGLSGQLDSQAPPHWARATIAAQGRLHPLDTLSGKDGKLPLPAGALLILAQPRPLSPQENVALDDWVRAGGRVLLFADPMLTADSAFALGDRRRPQDIVLLSPILSRWGLELRFDADQPAGERGIPFSGGSLPVNLPGRFALSRGSGCVVEAEGVAVRCRIDKGTVVAIADAALLEDGSPQAAARRAAVLAKLLKMLVDRN